MERTLIWQLAFRYLRGKRSANIVPVLSRISMVAIAVGSAAMIIVFSVFNGLESFIKDSYKAFYPDVKISPARGKFFSDSLIRLQDIRHINGVQSVAPLIEDNALAGDENEFSTSATQQHIVAVKGIDNSYFQVNEVSKFIDKDGVDSVSTGQPYTAILGIELAHILGVETQNSFSYIQLYYLNPSVKNPEADPENAFQTLKLHPAGTFRTMGEFDDKYVLAPLSLVQDLFHAPGKYSSVEVKVAPGEVAQVKKELQDKLGKDFKVRTRFEQNQTLYMVMKAEKSGVFTILLFVIIIAAFNMVGALSMLVLEKRKDIAILEAMGATRPMIRRVFLLEGVLWSFIGGLFGTIFGVVICLLQQKYKIIGMQGMAVDAYPVVVSPLDIVIVLSIIIIIGFCAAWYPSRRAVQTVDVSLKSN